LGNNPERIQTMKDLFVLGLVLVACGIASISVGHLYDLSALVTVGVYTGVLWGAALVMHIIDWFKWNKIRIEKHSPY